MCFWLILTEMDENKPNCTCRPCPSINTSSALRVMGVAGVCPRQVTTQPQIKLPVYHKAIQTTIYTPAYSHISSFHVNVLAYWTNAEQASASQKSPFCLRLKPCCREATALLNEFRSEANAAFRSASIRRTGKLLLMTVGGIVEELEVCGANRSTDFLLRRTSATTILS